MKQIAARVEIIAHRGASYDAPENTLAALEEAIGQGADWAECDVRRSADGVMFVHHDSHRRMNSLRRMNFEDIKALPGAGDIPTLEQVLRLAHGRIKLDIELKEAGYEDELLELVREYYGYRDFFISSFFDAVLVELKRLDAKVRTGLIVGQRLTDQDPLQALGDFFPQRRVQRTGANMVVCHYLIGDVIGRWWLRQRGIPVILWTVDRPQLIRRYLRDPNVIAIITNRPGLAVKLRDTAEAALTSAKTSK